MRIFSGIQPTGAKHLGNYIGAIRHWAEAQEDSLYCIVDLHSISVAYDPDDLRESTLSLAALLIACGLDPDRCILFVQSHNPDHAQGSWLLSSARTTWDTRAVMLGATADGNCRSPLRIRKPRRRSPSRIG